MPAKLILNSQRRKVFRTLELFAGFFVADEYICILRLEQLRGGDTASCGSNNLYLRMSELCNIHSDLWAAKSST